MAKRKADRANRPQPVRPDSTPPADRRGSQGRFQPDRRPEPRGFWLYGAHPVLAALGNAERRCRRFVMTAEAERAYGGRIAALLAARQGTPSAELLPRAEIERLLPQGAVHQGLAVAVDPLPEPSLDDICRATAGLAHAVVVVLDQVTDPHNVGAVLRSAAAFGARAVIITERHAPNATAAMAKAASGALEVVPLVRVVNLVRALHELKAAGFWCAGLDVGGPARLAQADVSGRIALVLGAEGQGMRRLTREHCDMLVRIPMAAGAVASLNVSTAAAIALYELNRLRA